MTVAPASPSCCAMARPMPLAEPVTKAVFDCRENISANKSIARGLPRNVFKNTRASQRRPEPLQSASASVTVALKEYFL